MSRLALALLAALLLAGSLPGSALAAGTTTTPGSGGVVAPGSSPIPTATGQATTTPATGSPLGAPATGTTPAKAAAGKGSGSLSGGAILAAVLGGLLVLAVLVWGAFRFTAYEPHWLLSMRHSFAEAGFRASGTWAEFTDWVRLGR